MQPRLSHFEQPKYILSETRYLASSPIFSVFLAKISFSRCDISLSSFFFLISCSFRATLFLFLFDFAFLLFSVFLLSSTLSDQTCHIVFLLYSLTLSGISYYQHCTATVLRRFLVVTSISSSKLDFSPTFFRLVKIVAHLLFPLYGGFHAKLSSVVATSAFAEMPLSPAVSDARLFSVVAATIALVLSPGLALCDGLIFSGTYAATAAAPPLSPAAHKVGQASTFTATAASTIRLGQVFVLASYYLPVLRLPLFYFTIVALTFLLSCLLLFCRRFICAES